MIGYGCSTTKTIETVYAQATTSHTSRQPPTSPTTTRIVDPTSIFEPRTPGPVTATPTPTPTPPAPNVKSNNNDTAKIVGGVLDSIIGLFPIGIAAFFFLRKRKAAQAQQPHSQQPPMQQQQQPIVSADSAPRQSQYSFLQSLISPLSPGQPQPQPTSFIHLNPQGAPPFMQMQPSGPYPQPYDPIPRPPAAAGYR